MTLLVSLRPFSKTRNLRVRRAGGLGFPAGDADRAGPPGGVAFVFQGGGSLAASQVGMLRALAAAGLTPDLVIGSSAGALNAVAFASDPSPAGLDGLETVWRSLRRRQVAPLSPRTLLAAVGRGDGLVSSSAFRALLASAPIATMLDGTLIPAHVVVTELASGAAVVLSDGPAVPALLASCAFPGLFPPVHLGPRLLIDGGVSADVPVRQAEALGARTTYVLPAAAYGAGPGVPRGPMRLAFRALGQVLDSVARSDVAAARGPVHVLPAPFSEATSPVDFRDTARLIDEGYRLATDWLAARTVPTGVGAAVSSPIPSVAR